MKGAVVARMATMYTQSKNAIPVSKNKCLLELQQFNGCPNIDTLLENNKYQHHGSINDMNATFSDIIREDLKSNILNFPHKKFSLELDEFTDSADKTVVLFYIRYVNAAGELSIQYLASRELKQGNAEFIYNTTLEVLQDYCLETANMVGSATNGASVMLGPHSGVATHFKRLIPGLISVHCMAHHLQLAAKKTADTVPAVTKYIGIVNVLAKALKFSPKFGRCLESAKELDDIKAHKLKQVFFTRWLSFSNTVDALAGCIGPVITATYTIVIEREAKARAILQGAATHIGTISFLL